MTLLTAVAGASVGAGGSVGVGSLASEILGVALATLSTLKVGARACLSRFNKLLSGAATSAQRLLAWLDTLLGEIPNSCDDCARWRSL